MTVRFGTFCSLILLLAALLAGDVSEAGARAATFSFDSIWFYRDGTRIVPEIGATWLTVVFDPRSIPEDTGFGAVDASVDAAAVAGGDGAPTGAQVSDPAGDFIKKKARAMLRANRRLSEFLYDPNLAPNACFLRMRSGLKLPEIRQLISRLGRDGSIAYVHPTMVINGKSYAYFNSFELHWKTGTPEAQRKSLLLAARAALDPEDPKGGRYTVNVARIPFFKALNLLAEDIRVLRVTPHLVEVKPSISARLSLLMNGGNIGDGIPFTLTIAFTERVKIDPSSIATINLRPPELQKELFECSFDPYDYAGAVATSPIVITGRMALYAPGEFKLPPIRVSYSCPSCSDSGVRTIETEPVPFRVSSIIPRVASENRLVVPTDPVAPPFHHDQLRRQSLRYLFVALLCFAGIIPGVVWCMSLRPRLAEERNLRDERRKALQLAGRLRVLLLDQAPVPHWRYLEEVGGLLREYLLLLYGIEPRYRGGSGRRFMETLGDELPRECVAPLTALFAAIDDGVALEMEQHPDMERLQRDLMEIVDRVARDDAGRW